MKEIVKLQDKKFQSYISSKDIDKAIKKIASKINKDFKSEIPLFVSVINGSFMFTSDLLKKLNIDCELSFVKLASYKGTDSTGKAKKLIGVNENIKGRMVVVLEDIVDSGNTLESLMIELKKHKPKTIKIATLFFKPKAYKKSFKIDYKGMNIPNDFIVGFGLDYNGLGRNFKKVYSLKT